MALADYAAAFRSRKIALLLVLGFASGLPLALTAGTLQAWLAVEGVDIVTIGWFALVGQPYTYKFPWAPLTDRFPLAFLGTLSPKDSPWLTGLAALAVAFLSASQDIVVDAYRTDVLRAEERGAGA